LKKLRWFHFKFSTPTMNIFVCALAALTVFGIELTPGNWDEKTAGKTVFIKFLAPW